MSVDTSQEKPFIKYFIPKICNEQMVQALPGIEKVTENGANGMFEIDNIQELNEKLFDFIERVPTDEAYRQNQTFSREEFRGLIEPIPITSINATLGSLKGDNREDDGIFH